VRSLTGEMGSRVGKFMKRLKKFPLIFLIFGKKLKLEKYIKKLNKKF
jgi:hypothetical protein